MRGGYQIIDFQKKSLSSTNTNIDGIYDAISDNFNKALQLNSLNIGGTLKDDVYAFATKGTNKYTFDVYDGILTVTSADNVRWVSHDTIQTVISDIDDLQSDVAEHTEQISTLNSDIIYGLPAGTYSRPLMLSYGFITGGGTTLYLYIPINTKINVTEIEVTSLAISMRVPSGGYVGGTANYAATNLISTCTLQREQGLIEIAITLETGETNNTPCIGAANMTFTLS